MPLSNTEDEVKKYESKYPNCKEGNDDFFRGGCLKKLLRIQSLKASEQVYRKDSREGELEAPGGFEPPNNGFADRPLNHLGTTPRGTSNIPALPTGTRPLGPA